MPSPAAPGAQAPGARTPKTTVKDEEAMKVIERRMHAIVHLPESHGEDVQIMKYELQAMERGRRIAYRH